MDSRLKERLIGAAVLVVLGVVLIPWVLDGPDGPELSGEGADASLTLPAEVDKVPVRSQTIDLQERRYAADAENGEAAAEASGPAEPARPPFVLSEASAPPASTPAEPEASAPGVTPAPEPGWMVQLGSFSEQDNARRLADRVSTYGYTARVSAFRSGGRTMHRVRVGPADSRKEAEATASSLAAHGFVAQVVAAN